MMRVLALARDTRASTAVEFALVLPLLSAFLLGIIDVGRFAWTVNREEKATQAGVRYAVATNIVANGLVGYDFVNGTTITQGDIIPESAFGGATCALNAGAVACTCKTGATCPATLISSQDDAQTSFNNIVARMRYYLPDLVANQVQVSYDYSGLGYAGDPNGVDVAPLVRVTIVSHSFNPITFAAFRGSIAIAGVSAALTLEDGVGTASN